MWHEQHVKKYEEHHAMKNADIKIMFALLEKLKFTIFQNGKESEFESG